ncbi:MAG: hypothetical protein ACYCPT_12715 [Acidimicrobiales bacterium]
MSMIPHEIRLTQNQVARKANKPRGNFDHSPFQWGVVHAVHAGPPPSVDVYLDGTQNMNNTAFLTTGIRYLDGYDPVVGDGVVLIRGTNKSVSDRTVLGKLAGTPGSYALTPGISSTVTTTDPALGGVRVWSGTGAPPTALGSIGDVYIRTDGILGTSFIYRKTASTTWTASSA